MDESLPKLTSFENTKYLGGLQLAPIAPRGWMGVNFVTFYNLKKLTSIYFYQGVNLVVKLLKHGNFLTNFRFWLLWVELRKSTVPSSLNFLQAYWKLRLGHAPDSISIKKQILLGISKSIGVLSPYLLCINLSVLSIYWDSM